MTEAAERIRSIILRGGPGVPAGPGVEAGDSSAIVGTQPLRDPNTGAPLQPGVTAQGVRPDLRQATAAPQQAGAVDVLSTIPPQLLQALVDQGFNEASIRALITNAEANFVAPIDAITAQIRTGQQIQKAERDLAPQDPRQFNQTFEDLQVKAIQDGNFELANQVRQFQNQPTDLQAFNAAVQLATSPADIATLSAIARGVFPRQAPSPGNVESLPLSPALQRAGQNLFGVGGDRLPAPSGLPQAQDAVSVPAQIAPEVPAQAPAPLSIEETIQQSGGFAGIQPPVGQHLQEGFGGGFLQQSPVPFAQPQQVQRQLAPELAFPGADSIRFRTPQEQAGFTRAPEPNRFPSTQQPGEFAPLPPVESFELPPAPSTFGDRPEERVSAGLTASEIVFPPGSPGASFDPASLANLTEDQIRFLGGRIINRGAPPPPAPQRPFTPPVAPAGLQGPTNFGQQPSQGNPLIPEGTPVSQINLNGQPAEVPVGIGQLFGGIQGNQVIEKPQSFLGAVGLPLPSAQGFSRLSAGEQDEFFKLARSQGLDPRDVERELQHTRPAGLPRPRIQSAARR